MIEINSQTYIYALHLLMLLAIFAVIAVIYSLRDSKLPVVSVKLFQAYFGLGLIGWLVLASKELGWVDKGDQPSFVFYIICSLMLFLAVVECVRNKFQTTLLVSFHLLLIGAVLWVDSNSNKMLIVSIYAVIIYSIISFSVVQRAIKKMNMGYAIIGAGTFIAICTALFQVYGLVVFQDVSLSYSAAVIASSTGFILVGIGFLAAILINEHKQLKSLTLTDPLTGLLNRRGLDYAARVILSAAERNNGFVSALAIDIDHFKKINDNYGHDVGDKALKVFSETLLNIPRANDVVCRFGGEEFVVILANTSTEDAAKLAERIRVVFQELEIMCVPDIVRITASFGVATRCGTVDINRLLKDADKALYRAKAEGRNKVCVAVDDELSTV